MKERIIEILKNKSKQSYTIMEINDALNLKSAEELNSLQNILDNMATSLDGKLYYSEKKKTYTLIENLDFIKGELEIKNDNKFGFVKVIGSDNDIYIGKNNLNTASDGDIVLIEITNKLKNEGKIIKILKRNDEEIVGKLIMHNNKYYVRRLGTNDKEIEVSKTKILYATESDIVSIKKINNNYEVVKVITTNNDVNASSEIDNLIKGYAYQNGFNPEFNEEVEKELESIPTEVLIKDIAGRKDLRNKTIFTIDGKDTKDIDDAISLETLDNGNKLLGVHIADVSHYVKENTALGNEAYNRATSGYFGDKVVPMLPHKLSNGICSLNEGVDRLAMSCMMEIDSKGNIISVDVFPSLIRSAKKMNYDEVNNVLMDLDYDKDYELYTDILKDMGMLAKILEKKFVSNGYVEFESKEPKFIFNENREVIDIKLREQREAEKLIEMFMLSANISVADYISNFGISLPYRIHDKPKEEKLADFLRLLSTKGIVLKFDPKKISGLDYQKMIGEINEKLDENVALVFNSLAIRTMSKAIYSPDNIGHFGLGFKKYCHFTSPIRRFPDLTVHRILKDIFYNFDQSKIQYWENNLDAICDNSSKREQDAINCERDVDKMLSASYLQDKVGTIFEAVVSGVNNFGIFVQLDNTTEGLIKREYLYGDTYVYDEYQNALVGRNKNNKYTYGDVITVKLLSADPVSAKIDFEVYDRLYQEKKESNVKTRKRKK